MGDALAELKRRARMMWAAGKWDDIAELGQPVGRDLVSRLDVTGGQDVLDVGAGSGNAAIYAAQAGARVVASDLTPQLFDDGRARAQRNGVELEWVEADAEALPFEDESFDVVMSTFGAMFAPRHAVVASELARVCRPGGRIGLTTWPPGSLPAMIMTRTERFMPPQPDFVQPPLLWGGEAHVRELFEPHGVSVSFQRGDLAHDGFTTAEEYAEFIQSRLGPVVMAKAMLTQQGRWDEYHAISLATTEGATTPTERGVAVHNHYLITLGTKAG